MDSLSDEETDKVFFVFFSRYMIHIYSNTMNIFFDQPDTIIIWVLLTQIFSEIQICHTFKYVLNICNQNILAYIYI